MGRVRSRSAGSRADRRPFGWLDGTPIGSLTGLDTRAYKLEAVRLGASAGVASSMTGEIRFDRFVSTNGSTIGP